MRCDRVDVLLLEPVPTASQQRWTGDALYAAIRAKPRRSSATAPTMCFVSMTRPTWWCRGRHTTWSLRPPDYTLPTASTSWSRGLRQAGCRKQRCGGRRVYAATRASGALIGNSHNDSFAVHNAAGHLCRDGRQHRPVYAAANFTLPTNWTRCCWRGPLAGHRQHVPSTCWSANAGVASTSWPAGGRSAGLAGTAGTVMRGRAMNLRRPQCHGTTSHHFGMPGPRCSLTRACLRTFAAHASASQVGVNTVSPDANNAVTLETSKDEPHGEQFPFVCRGVTASLARTTLADRAQRISRRVHMRRSRSPANTAFRLVDTQHHRIPREASGTLDVDRGGIESASSRERGAFSTCGGRKVLDVVIFRGGSETVDFVRGERRHVSTVGSRPSRPAARQQRIARRIFSVKLRNRSTAPRATPPISSADANHIRRRPRSARGGASGPNVSSGGVASAAIVSGRRPACLRQRFGTMVSGGPQSFLGGIATSTTVASANCRLGSGTVSASTSAAAAARPSPTAARSTLSAGKVFHGVTVRAAALRLVSSGAQT